jgi:hypothetical protein
VEAGKPRYDASLSERQALASRFIAAAEGGELDSLVSFLAESAAFYGVGGGKARAYTRPLLGRERAAKAVWSIFKTSRMFGVTFRVALVNGQPGVLNFDAEGRLVSVQEIEVVDGAVQGVRSIINPDKLAHLGYPLALVPEATTDYP